MSETDSNPRSINLVVADANTEKAFLANAKKEAKREWRAEHGVQIQERRGRPSKQLEVVPLIRKVLSGLPKKRQTIRHVTNLTHQEFLSKSQKLLDHDTIKKYVKILLFKQIPIDKRTRTQQLFLQKHDRPWDRIREIIREHQMAGRPGRLILAQMQKDKKHMLAKYGIAPQ